MSALRTSMLGMALCVTLTLASSLAHATEVPLITGEQWIHSSEPLKKAYLIGIANAYEVETAFHGAKTPSDDQSLIPRFGRGLKGHTLDTVRQGLDTWYAAHPDRLNRPVLETLWFEMVVPGLRQNK